MTMRAATYARFSTDKQRDASIEDQIRNCRNYAHRQEWLIVKHFEDKGISGISKDRAGFNAMLAAAKAGEFDVLLVDDLSRFSRDDVETKQVIRRFKFQGLRIIGVSDGYDSAQKGEKIQSTMRGLMNEIYLDDLREKTHRGLYGQALAGNNTGGRSYGYRHVPIEDPSRLDPHGRPIINAVRREVDEAQAHVIIQIFQWYADGWSPRAIARELNTRAIPSPRGGKWQQTAIHGDPNEGTGILNNWLYMGQNVWNRREWRKNPDTGRRTYIQRPEAEWVRTEMPELRIIDDALWERVKARQKRQSAEKGERVKKGLRAASADASGRSTGRGPKYLFPSLLKCGCCGANYVMHSTTSYGCALNINGGDAACSNRLRLPRKLAELRLLDALKQDLFTPEASELFVKETTRLLRERAATLQPDLKRAQKDVEAANREIDNLMAAIKAGIITASTKAALEAAETAKVEAESKLAAATGMDERAVQRVTAMLPRALDRYRAMLDDINAVLSRDVARARTHLKDLLGEVRLHPAGHGLEAELDADWSKVISPANSGELARLKVLLVAGAGLEPATFGL